MHARLLTHECQYAKGDVTDVMVDGLCMCLTTPTGADINQTNHSGDTALWVACDTGAVEIVRTLLCHPRIDINRGMAHVPLHSALIHGYADIVKMMVDAGASVNKVRVMVDVEASVMVRAGVSVNKGRVMVDVAASVNHVTHG